MFCTNCGSPIPEGNAFCTNCGTRVEVQPTPAAAAAAEPELQDAQTASTPEADVEAAATVAIPAAAAEAAAETTPAAAEATPASVDTVASASYEQSAAVATTPVTTPTTSSVATPAATTPATTPVTTPATQIQVPIMTAPATSYDSYASNQYAGQVPAGAAYQQQQYQQQPQQPQKKSKKGLIIGIIAFVVIVAAAVVAYIFAIGPALKAGKEYDVDLMTTGSALESVTTTPAGINIKGTILSDGKSFNEDYFVSGKDTIKLHEGSYTATIMAPVIASDGTLIQFTPETVKFEVTESGASKQVMFTASAVEDSALTTELITQAENVANKSDEDTSTVSGYATKAKDKLAAQEKAKAEAEAKKKAEEEAKKKAEEEAKAHTSGATWYVCASDFVTMRKSPSTSASEIMKITSRKAVTYVSDAGSGWIKIRYDGKEGYVLERFISPDKDHPLDYGDV